MDSEKIAVKRKRFLTGPTSGQLESRRCREKINNFVGDRIFLASKSARLRVQGAVASPEITDQDTTSSLFARAVNEFFS